MTLSLVRKLQLTPVVNAELMCLGCDFHATSMAVSQLISSPDLSQTSARPQPDQTEAGKSVE
jgi:hypothetical protein